METEAKALRVGQKFLYAGKDGPTYTVESVKLANRSGTVVYVEARGSGGERATFMFPPEASINVVASPPEGVVPVHPNDVTVGDLELSLRAGFKAIILEADAFHPLAVHVLDLMKAAYEAGRRDGMRLTVR